MLMLVKDLILHRKKKMLLSGETLDGIRISLMERPDKNHFIGSLDKPIMKSDRKIKWSSFHTKVNNQVQACLSVKFLKISC